MATTSKDIIRLSKTKQVSRALNIAKKKYPTLSDAEILKLGLSKIITDYPEIFPREDRDQIRLAAAYALGSDYLEDPEEAIYKISMGKKVQFS